MYVFFLPPRLTRFLEICISRFCAVLRQLLLYPEILLFVHGLPSNSNFLLCVPVLTGENIAERQDDAIKSPINSFIYYEYIFLLCHLKNSLFHSCRFIFCEQMFCLHGLKMHLYYYPAFYLFI